MKSEMTRRSIFAALLVPVVAPAVAALVPAPVAAAAPVFKGIEYAQPCDLAMMDLIEARMEAAFLQMSAILEDNIRLNGWSADLGGEFLQSHDLSLLEPTRYVTYGSAPRNGPLV